MWELVRDAFGDLFELDSRLWRTLIPLLLRPGRLTKDYLEGRRARYMPPFRMYLVLSLIFFVVVFFDPTDDLSLLFEPEPAPTPEEIAEQEQAVSDKRKEAEAGVNEVLQELANEGIISEDTREAAEEAEGTNFRITSDEPDGGLNFQIDEETGECTVTGAESLPDWLQRRLTPERLKKLCQEIGDDGGKTLGDLLLDNIPVALIVLLPIMALVLKALYPLSRRYFVEHLLFFVHYHSFFFLILTLQFLFARLASLVHLPEVLKVLVLVAAAFYIPVYLYKAMRQVYEQGHFFTFTKYVVLVVAYMVGATFTMLGALLFALVSAV